MAVGLPLTKASVQILLLCSGVMSFVWYAWVYLDKPSLGLRLPIPGTDISTPKTPPSFTVPDAPPAPLTSNIPAPSSGFEDACAAISAADLEQLLKVERPTVVAFDKGKPIQTGSQVNAPNDVCIVISVPQTSSPGEEFNDVPVFNTGPDSIHLLLTSEANIITLPPPRPLLPQPRAQQLFSFQPILYHSTVSFQYAGAYAIHAEVEWANWHWAQEWEAFLNQDPQMTRFKNGVEKFNSASEAPSLEEEKPGYVFDPLPVSPIDIHPSILEVARSEDPEMRPDCSDTVTATNGQWVHAASHVELPVREEMVDEWGYAWDSPECVSSFFSTSEIFDCLAGKTLHVYGDSMLRRWAKVLLTGGEWCHNVTHHCQAEDSRDEEPVDLLFMTEEGQLVETQGSASQFGEDDHAPFTFGKGSTLMFNWVHSLALSPHVWMKKLYDDEDVIGMHRDTIIRPGAVARPPPGQGDADVVLLGFGAWDQAFAPTFDMFEKQLPPLRDAVMQAYDGKPIYLRLANSWCCRKRDVAWRRYTGVRVQHFDDLVRDAFEVEGAVAMDGKMHVVDPAKTGGRPEVYKDYGLVGSNHPRASHTRIEVGMLLDQMCVRDENGAVRFREP